MKNFVIAIDGNCGSGKSTLAAILKEALECNVFHMDDYYLPFSKRDSQWENLPAGNMDIERFRTEVLEAIKQGVEVNYQPYHCRTDRLKAGIIVPTRQINIVEGSYSHHPDFDEYYDLKIFLTCSKEEQEHRLKVREGERFTFYQLRWIPMEERYYQAFDIKNRAHKVIETTGYEVYEEILSQITEVYKKI